MGLLAGYWASRLEQIDEEGLPRTLSPDDDQQDSDDGEQQADADEHPCHVGDEPDHGCHSRSRLMVIG
jgi:hypothetical protein